MFVVLSERRRRRLRSSRFLRFATPSAVSFLREARETRRRNTSVRAAMFGDAVRVRFRDGARICERETSAEDRIVNFRGGYLFYGGPR